MYITTMLVGNNIVMVIYGILMSAFLMQQLEFLHLSVGVELLVETVISTLIILVFAEFLPKMIFRLRSNLFLKIFAVPVFLFYLLFFPLSYFSVWLGRGLLQLLTGKRMEQKESNRAFGKIDLNNLIEEGEQGATEKEEIQEIRLFRNVLDFSEVKLRECIVPRPDVVALSIDSSIEELSRVFVESGLSRILIYKDSIDNIIGYVHISALFYQPTTIKEVLSKILVVPETMPAQRLLNLFLKDRKSIAVVVDEFGVTAGIVTTEDIMEEIFGEIEDEHDHLNLKEIRLSDREYIFSGRLEVDYLNEKYQLDLEEREEYETLAGLILFFNESIPAVGETIEIGGLTFKILNVKNARIEEVKVIL
jgi:CBS domain containing-hemolysin-like protein